MTGSVKPDQETTTALPIIPPEVVVRTAMATAGWIVTCCGKCGKTKRESNADQDQEAAAVVEDDDHNIQVKDEQLPTNRTSIPSVDHHQRGSTTTAVTHHHHQHPDSDSMSQSPSGSRGQVLRTVQIHPTVDDFNVVDSTTSAAANTTASSAVEKEEEALELEDQEGSQQHQLVTVRISKL